MKPKFILATGASLFLFAASGYSQWAVIDVAHIAQDEVNQTLNYVDYVGTQVNTYEQQLNQVEQLKRLGDPGTLTNLAGLNKLGTSVQTLGAPMQGTPQLTGGVSSLTSGSVFAAQRGFVDANFLQPARHLPADQLHGCDQWWHDLYPVTRSVRLQRRGRQRIEQLRLADGGHRHPANEVDLANQ